MRMTTFEDLTSDIYDDTGILASNIIQETLRWLDQHPNEIPQPAVTHSRVNGWIRKQGADYARGFQAGIDAIGGRVIPDPEPTNAEKLEERGHHDKVSDELREWKHRHPIANLFPFKGGPE